jgi:hypothetical protein
MIFDLLILRVGKNDPNDAVLVGRHVDDVIPDGARIIRRDMTWDGRGSRRSRESRRSRRNGLLVKLSDHVAEETKVLLRIGKVAGTIIGRRRQKRLGHVIGPVGESRKGLGAGRGILGDRLVGRGR